MTDQGRTAACLAVGSELLGEEKLDRNSLTITRALAGYGIAVTEKPEGTIWWSSPVDSAPRPTT